MLYQRTYRPLSHFSQLFRNSFNLALCRSLTLAMSSPPSYPKKSKRRFHPVYGTTEWIESYRPGGYHPVHLGDIFKDGQYEILRKLGEGSFSTVWLAHDRQLSRYVALKIIIANDMITATRELSIHCHLAQLPAGPKHLVSLLDSFKHHGPNGEHLCLVFEPMGPDTQTMLDELSCNKPYDHTPRYPTKTSKEILRQVLLGLDFLHQNGVVHGDHKPGNILFSICDLNRIGKDKLKQDPNSNAIIPVKRLDGKIDQWAPRYLVRSESLAEFVDTESDFAVKISDLGGAFWLSDPPKKNVTPIGLRAPELIFGSAFDQSIDVWSLGCIIFEFITGRQLFPLISFGSTQEETDDDHLLQMSDILGPLPENIFSKWTRSKRYFSPSGERFNSLIGDNNKPPNPPEDLSLRPPPLEQFLDEVKPHDIENEEVVVLKSLLRKILQYDPAKRPSTSELLQHPWFAKAGHH